jgi:hypothetical protein
VTVWKPVFGTTHKGEEKDGNMKEDESMEKACCLLEVASAQSGALVVVAGQG